MQNSFKAQCTIPTNYRIPSQQKPEFKCRIPSRLSAEFLRIAEFLLSENKSLSSSAEFLKDSVENSYELQNSLELRFLATECTNPTNYRILSSYDSWPLSHNSSCFLQVRNSCKHLQLYLSKKKVECQKIMVE